MGVFGGLGWGVILFDFYFKFNFEFLGYCLVWVEVVCDKCWNKGIYGFKRVWRREK